MRKSLLSELPVPSVDLVGWPWTEESDPNLFDTSIEWPKISIVTPSLNQGDFIEETIRSVLLQNYPNLEYIVIDGKSIDDSLGIIKKYASWFTFWVSEKDCGQSEAINKGFLHCTGDIFNFINSDDHYYPGVFYRIASEWMKKPFDAFIGRVNAINVNTGEVNSANGTVYEKPTARNIGLVSPIDQSGLFYKLARIEPLFPLSEVLHYSLDYELWVRFQISIENPVITKVLDIITGCKFHEKSKSSQFLRALPTDKDPKFLIDINTIFYGLALSINNIAASQAIKEFLPSLTQGYECKLNYTQRERVLIEQILSYYLNKWTGFLYCNNQFRKARNVIRLVRPEHLASRELNQYRKILKRTMLPYVLLRLMKYLKLLSSKLVYYPH